MLVRRETGADVGAVREVVAQAFSHDPRTGAAVTGEPVEVRLLDALRRDAGWWPELSWVVEVQGRVVGHGVCTRATVGAVQVVGLGPIGVTPGVQGRGAGSALVHALLGAADALGVPLVGLLGAPAYYGRFGFRPAAELGVAAPEPLWGDHFQVRALSAHDEGLRGTFRYARPFEELDEP